MKLAVLMFGHAERLSPVCHLTARREKLLSQRGLRLRHPGIRAQSCLADSEWASQFPCPQNFRLEHVAFSTSIQQCCWVQKRRSIHECIHRIAIVCSQFPSPIFSVCFEQTHSAQPRARVVSCRPGGPAISSLPSCPARWRSLDFKSRALGAFLLWVNPKQLTK